MDREDQIELMREAEERAAQQLRNRAQSAAYRAAITRHDHLVDRVASPSCCYEEVVTACA